MGSLQCTHSNALDIASQELARIFSYVVLYLLSFYLMCRMSLHACGYLLLVLRAEVGIQMLLWLGAVLQ